MTEKEKMLTGKIYDASDEELKRFRETAHRLSREYNLLDECDLNARAKILRALLPNADKSAYLQGPVQFDYGIFTELGENFYANFNLTVLDCAPVKIGNNVFIGPNCSLVTPIHPLLSRERNPSIRADGSVFAQEYAKPIIIGDDCWLATNVTVLRRSGYRKRMRYCSGKRRNGRNSAEFSCRRHSMQGDSNAV